MNIILFKEYNLLEVDHMKLIKSLVISIVLLLLFNIPITILDYYNLVNDKFINILQVISFIIIFIISGLFLGFKLRKKALVNGLKLSSIFIALLYLLILISPLEFTINTFISYILIIILVNIGTFIGVNKKKVK